MEYAPRDEDKEPSSAAFTSRLVRRGGYFEVPEVPGNGVELVEDYATVAPARAKPMKLNDLLRDDGSVLGGVV
jgi:hypothetical protein